MKTNESEKNGKKYRPYLNPKELVLDYCEKMGIQNISMSYPQIWIKDDEAISLITDFFDDCICLGSLDYSMEDLFNDFTYLDGSVLGKETKIVE